MHLIFAQIFPLEIASVDAFAGAGLITSLLVALRKTGGLTSAYQGNQIAITVLVSIAVIGIASGALLGCGVNPEGVWTDLLMFGIAAATLLVGGRFLGIALRAIRQWS